MKFAVDTNKLSSGKLQRHSLCLAEALCCWPVELFEFRPKARWFQRQLTVLRVHAADCLATGSTLILNLQGSLVQSVEFLLTWASWTSAPGAENNFEGCLDARQMVKA